DDHALEARNRFCDLFIVFGRDLLRIEKAARVVQLDLPDRWQLGERRADLLRNRTARHDLVQRVGPQVAHDATERTLAVGQEDDGSRHQLTGRSGLFFPDGRVGTMRIDWLLGLTVFQDEAIESFPRHATECESSPWVCAG